MTNDEWDFKVDAKNKVEQGSIPKNDEKPTPRARKLELDLESAVRSRSLRVHAGKSYDVKVASVRERFTALGIDLIFILVSSLVFKFAVYDAYLSQHLNFLNAYIECLLLSYLLIYFLLLKVTGHSLGKKIKKIKIEDIDGGPLDFKRLFLREVFLKPLFLFLVFPWLYYILSKKHTALHDHLCKSSVAVWDLALDSSQS